jgi:hypothetical protein
MSASISCINLASSSSAGLGNTPEVPCERLLPPAVAEGAGFKCAGFKAGWGLPEDRQPVVEKKKTIESKILPIIGPNLYILSLTTLSIIYY